MSQHASGKLEAMQSGDHYILKTEQGNVAQTLRLDAFIDGTQTANAARLCRAWNLLDSYDEMRLALESIVMRMESEMRRFPANEVTKRKRFIEVANAILKKTGEGK